MSNHRNTSSEEFKKFIECLTQDSEIDTKDLILIPAKWDKSPDVKGKIKEKIEDVRLSTNQSERRLAEKKGNVALYLGDSLAVMDVDDQKKALDYIDNEEPTRTLACSSRTGKPHLYYKKGDGIEGADISEVLELRTGWRYVLVPGSCAYDRKEFEETGEKNWGLYQVENENPPRTLEVEDLPPKLRPGEEVEGPRTRRKTGGFSNSHGWGIGEIRERDDKLDALLRHLNPSDNHKDCDFPSRSEADLATMSKLLYWEFEDQDIFDILRTYRRYEKTERNDYLERTLSKAKSKSFKTISTDVEPVCWSPTEGDFYEKDGKFVPKLLADDIRKDNTFATHLDSQEIYVYSDGIFERRGEQVIEKETQKRLASKAKNTKVREVKGVIKRETYRDPEEFGGPKNEIPCKNGVLNIDTLELKEHTEDRIFLSKIPVEYDPEADCPKIKSFLKDILKPSDIPLIQEFIGYCLLKDYPLAKAFILLGEGANGKSTLIKLIEIFLGDDNTVGPSLQDLLDDKFSSVRLHGALLCSHADIPETEIVGAGEFKMLTGGDKMEAQFKYGDRFNFHNYAKMIFSANRLPPTQDRSKAFYRRWIILDFPNEFPEDDPDTDPNIIDKLTTVEELSGLLNWALEGYQRLMEQGHFSHTKGRREIAERWIRETDSLRAFCDFALKKKEGQAIPKNDLWEGPYKDFCERHDIYVVKKGQVTKRLPSILNFTRKRRLTVDGGREFCWDDLGFTKEFKREFGDSVTNVRVVTPMRQQPLTREKDKESIDNNIESVEHKYDSLDTSDTCDECGLKEAEYSVPQKDGTMLHLCENCFEEMGFDG